MIKSMTGFGRAEKIIEGRDILVEIKSVNHRFFDFSARISRGYGFLEDKVKTYLQKCVTRGKIDVLVSLETLDDTQAEVAVNHSLAAGYLAALRELRNEYGLPDDITVSTVARYQDIFTVRHAQEDEEKVWSQVAEVLREAAVPLLAMRESEGARLKEDLAARTRTILRAVAKIEERSPKTVEEFRVKFTERLNSLLDGAGVDEQRILTEAAVFADKVSVTEETVRLRSHVSQFGELMESGDAVGRRLDFLTQEMNREANTIGSKCADAEISHIVVDMKAEIEKIREQIQNIE